MSHTRQRLLRDRIDQRTDRRAAHLRETRQIEAMGADSEQR
jgi:hypothetical protein